MGFRLGTIGFALFVCLHLSANAAFATTYYVDASNPNGRGDGNSCSAAQSISSPKLTINGGISCMVGGDTLNVRAGTYHDSINYNIPSGTGFPTGATRLQGYSGDAVPTMNGSLTLAAENNIIWTGININDAGDSGNTTDCILINSASNILITQSDISNCQRHGIMANDGNSAPLSNLTFSYLKVHNTGQGYLTSGDPRHHNFYIAAHNFTTGPIIIDHVESYNTGNPANAGTGGPSGSAANSWGIQIYSTSTGFLNGVVVSNSYIHDNNQGIVVGSGNNHKVFNNVLYNNDLPTSSCEAAITVGYGSADNTQVYNNTIVGNSCNGVAYGISVGTFGAPTNTIIKNNILWQNGNDSINLAAGSGTVTGNNRMGVDPNFVNPSTLDFHLQSTSTALNTAANLSSIFTTDKDGKIRPASGNWDPGAYAAGSSASITTTAPAAPTNLHLLP